MKTCLKCNKELSGRWQLKFCSKSCSVSYTNTGKRKYGVDPKRNCVFCNKEFIASESKRKFCSMKCSSNYMVNKTFIKIRTEQSGNGMAVNTIKKFMLHENGVVCSICNNTEWNNLPIPLVMDHINGNANDNLISNLRLVCGNCDMQLPTYKNKNKGNGRFNRMQRYKNNKSF